MLRRTLLTLLALCPWPLLVALVFGGALPPGWGAWLFAVPAAAVPVLLAALGAGGGRGLRRRALVLGALFLSLAGTFALLLAGVGGGHPGGRLVILLVGLWLIPLPLATLGYAFDARWRRRGEGGP